MAIEKRFHERYIKHCDITRAYDWTSATWARLMLAKMWLAVCNPLQCQETDAAGLAPRNLRQVAFERSVQMLELAGHAGDGPQSCTVAMAVHDASPMAPPLSLCWPISAYIRAMACPLERGW